MLFDLGWSEILLIGTVALVFIGPKDLPKALRVAGYWVRKARTLSREFQSSIDQMIREAELDEMRQDLKKAAEFDLDKEFRNTIDPTGSLAESLKPPELPDFYATAAVPAPAAGNGLDPAVTPIAAADAVPIVPAPQSEPDEMAVIVPAPQSEPDEMAVIVPAPRSEPGEMAAIVPAPRFGPDEIAEAKPAPQAAPAETGDGHGIVPPPP